VEFTARSAPLGFASWRPILTMLVILALVVAASAVLIAGSKRARPPLFGPARNGAVIYDNGNGDILSLDPATGKAVTVIGGASDDRYPTVSPDGQRLLFVRFAGESGTLYTANVDGSAIEAVAPAADSSWNEWSPDGESLVFIAETGGTPVIRDVTTGTNRPLPVSSPVHVAQWLTNSQLLLAAQPQSDGARTYWVINADGTDQRLLNTPDACCGANVLAGRGLLAWTSWGTADNTHGRIHVLDIASGKDTLLASTDKPGLIFLDGRFSPDGNWLLVNQFGGGVTGAQPALIAADGSGDVVKIGPEIPRVNDEVGAEVRATFSPDGTQLLMTYADGSAWLYDVPSGKGSKVGWAGVVNTTWQRLAVRD
jgi:Tol biopolymer transport system component